MTISPNDYIYLTTLIKAKSGISLGEDKAYLINSRFSTLLTKYNSNDISDLIQKIKSNNDSELIKDVIEVMTTNESSFLRDVKPFDYFKNTIIPSILEKSPNKRSFRIWSAACSTGQEPYSIAMTILENVKWQDFQFEIVATDISEQVLEKAKSAAYSQFEVQRGLPITMLLKYFTKNNDIWYINDKVKNMVRFSYCNLVEDFSQLGTFDIVFCRNVMIYFDVDTKQKVLNNIAKRLDAHGMLLLGSAESIYGIETGFESFKDIVGIYSLK